MSSSPPSKITKMSEVNADSPFTVKTEKNIQELKEEVKKKAAENPITEEPENPITEEPVKKETQNYNDFSNDGTVLKFKKSSEFATSPIRTSKHAAGFDLFSAEDKTIEGQGHGCVKTDIAVALPEGTYGRVAPRSGLAVKKFIDVGAGVVDYDYRGDIGVVLFNHLKEPFTVKRGERIAQFIVEKIATPKLVEVTDLDATERGDGAYGSTGST